jgi:hydroxyacylglutathione hydrolase
MNLEDHVGDIVRKARLAANIPLAALAQASGVGEHEYAAFEETGLSPQPIRFAVLGPLLGLDAARLTRIATGWLPAPVDLRQWKELRIISTTQGGNKVNCFLAWDSATGEAALFDTGWDADPLFKILDEHSADLKHLFITHHHGDHVAALGLIQKKHPRIQIHSNDNLAPPALRNRPGEIVRIGALQVGNLATPGHSEDGATYLIQGFPQNPPLVAVVGDALFAGSMGRGFQSATLLRQSVEQHILSLPPTTLLCPGHGPLTTVSEELANNPFFP